MQRGGKHISNHCRSDARQSACPYGGDHQQVKKVNRVCSDLGREPTTAELAEEMKMDMESVRCNGSLRTQCPLRRLSEKRKTAISRLREDEDSLHLSMPHPIRCLSSSSKTLDTLPGARVLNTGLAWRMGGLDLEEVGRSCDQGTESQIEAKALQLRHPSRSKLRDYLTSRSSRRRTGCRTGNLEIFLV